MSQGHQTFCSPFLPGIQFPISYHNANRGRLDSEPAISREALINTLNVIIASFPHWMSNNIHRGDMGSTTLGYLITCRHCYSHRGVWSLSSVGGQLDGVDGEYVLFFIPVGLIGMPKVSLLLKPTNHYTLSIIHHTTLYDL